MNPYRWGAVLLLAGILVTLTIATIVGPENRAVALGLVIAIAGIVFSAIYFLRGEEVHWRLRTRRGGRSL